MSESDNEESVKLISSLIRKRGATKGLLTKFSTQFGDQNTFHGLSKEMLIMKRERLKSTFDKYDYFNLEICGLDETKFDADYANVENSYMKSYTIISEKIDNFDKKHEGETKHSCHSIPTKLPHITIPIYTGKYTEFKAFIGLFDSLIHKSERLDNVQRFFYLRNYLQGEPLELIKNLTITSENYTEARNILYDKYDNEYKITNELIGSILDIVPIQKSTSHNIRQF